MDRIQKQSILLVIQTLEGQLQALRSLIGLTDVSTAFDRQGQNPQETGYTNDKEDELIEEALKIEAEKEEFLQNVFEQAREIPDLEG